VKVAVNNGNGVSVGKGVAEGSGVKVIVGSGDGDGVQVSGNKLRGVGVDVGKAIVGGKVGGGKGLRSESGLMKIAKNPAVTHTTISRTRTVSTLKITPETLPLGWGWSSR
jgi:hypothetical protein